MRTGKRHRRRRAAITLAVLLVEATPLWRRGYGIGGNVVVRCRAGHLFTTIWIPGVSVKAVRLGWWRFQRCPVEDHWSIVTPVDRASLTEPERVRADERRDIRLP